MLAIHTNTLVFPGFTLPLVLKTDYYESENLLEDIRKGYTFALICTEYVRKKLFLHLFFLFSLSKSRTRLFEYGIIMEVYETSYRRGTINLKAKGRQRCRIVSGQEVRPGRIHKVTVKVLGEPTISSPIASTELQSLRKHRSTSVCDYETMLRNYRYRR